jgi:CheY-like chemotaxis protein
MSSQQLRVLIVEDNMLNAKFAEAVLKKLNCSIDHATNGKKGLKCSCKTITI